MNEELVETVAKNLFRFFETQDAENLNESFKIYCEDMGECSGRDRKRKEMLMSNCRFTANQLLKPN